MTNRPSSIRQGDVLLVTVKQLPAGCIEVPLDKGRIVLAYGEVTGHSHAIADHVQTVSPGAAAEIAEAVIARARLWRAPNGLRYLEVTEPVHLGHEEHALYTGLLGSPNGKTMIPPGIHKVPAQVEYTPAEIRRVAD
jgi:hypothetical protein